MQDPMYEAYVTISWCPTDIKSLHEDWSDEKCMDALSEIAGMLEDRSIELGWEVIENLLDYYEDSEDGE